jgi:23S rRNA (guanosine2251-2'-O)-methyltransferase
MASFMKVKGKSGTRDKGRGTRREVQSSKFKVQGSEFKDQRSKIKDQRADSRLTTHDSPLIFGVLPVLEALRAGTRRIEKIMVAEGAHERRLNEILSLAREAGIPFQKIPRANLSRFVEGGANHQGVVAFVAAADYANADELFEVIVSKEDALAVILDGVEDPRNLGAILRTVDCVGAHGVFIPERRAVGLTETVAKTSAGATEYVKIAKVTNISRLIDDLKERNVWTIGTSADAEMEYTDWDWTQRCALVLGSEGKGLHRLVAEKCDVLVKIPLLGQIESLNVSVAAGVILYEAIRQRREREKGRKGEEENESKVRKSKDEEQRTKD